MAKDLSFFGVMHPDFRSEVNLPKPGGIDADYLQRYSREHERNGFDGVLVGASAEMADSLQIAAYAAGKTDWLKFLIAHRPGPIHPTLAARKFAALDHLSRGRIILHAITSRDGETGREGDRLDKDQRYARTREHLQVLKRAWTSTERFSYSGEHYRFEDFRSEVLAYQKPRIKVSFAGDSPAAIEVGSAEADIYSLYAQPLKQTETLIATLRQRAEQQQREAPLEFTLIARLILGTTEQSAWKRAQRILEQVSGTSGYTGRENLSNPNFDGSPSVGDRRLIDLGKDGSVHDTALWAGISAVTGRGNSAALVGTPETVTEALLRYADLGVTNFIIHGFDPYEDVADYGREIIPVVRREWRNRHIKTPVFGPSRHAAE